MASASLFQFHRSQASRWYDRYVEVQKRIEQIEFAAIESIQLYNPQVTSKIQLKKAAKPLLQEHTEYMQLTGDRTWMMSAAQLNATMAMIYKD